MSSSDTEFVFLPLGGAGEIGMNVYLYGVGAPGHRQWLMVDLGITFAGEGEPGIDVVLPDLRFIEAERQQLAGIVLTHAHEDHVGAVHDLWGRLEVPIYATPFTCAMIKSKYEHYGTGAPVPLNEVALGDRFDVGPFNVELVHMAHSIPEPNGLVIRTEAGTAFHTGDWKLDPDPIVGPPVDERRLREIGDEGVDALICDSTNVLRDGVSPSEHDVADTLTTLIEQAPARVAVTTFASNLARLLSVARAAEKTGRHVVLAGRAMKRVVEAGRETGYVPADMVFLSEDDFAHLPRDKVVLLCTGSQGEPRAALARLAREEHPRVALDKGDRIIFSSKTIPGNEVAVGRIQNALALRGVEVVTEGDALVHVSGHPRRGELATLYGWLRPRVAVPMHGEAMHLQRHFQLAREFGAQHAIMPVNGEIARLMPGPPEIIDEAPAGRLFRDGDLLIPAEDGSVRERRKLAFAGMVSLAVVLNRKGEVVADPELALVGLPTSGDEGEGFETHLRDTVEGILDSLPRARRKDVEVVREALRRGVRGAANSWWGKRPICQVHVSVV